MEEHRAGSGTSHVIHLWNPSTKGLECALWLAPLKA